MRILRKRRIGILQVDKTKPSRGKSEAGASVLNTDGKIWFGTYLQHIELIIIQCSLYLYIIRKFYEILFRKPNVERIYIS